MLASIVQVTMLSGSSVWVGFTVQGSLASRVVLTSLATSSIIPVEGCVRNLVMLMAPITIAVFDEYTAPFQSMN